MPFSLSEEKRYARHFTLPDVGVEGQTQLKAARVLCVGAGGLGCGALPYLAAAGVGKIGIIDSDVVELSNLQRQILYSTADVGTFKAETAAKKLQALNPEIEIAFHVARFQGESAEKIAADYDIFLDGSDNFATRDQLNDISCQQKKPYVYASVSGFEGQASMFNAMPNSPCYRCLYDIPPPAEKIFPCIEAGVLGVLPGLLGLVQASAVLEWILHRGAPLSGYLLWVNAKTLTFKRWRLDKNTECSCA